MMGRIGRSTRARRCPRRMGGRSGANLHRVVSEARLLQVSRHLRGQLLVGDYIRQRPLGLFKLSVHVSIDAIESLVVLIENPVHGRVVRCREFGSRDYNAFVINDDVAAPRSFFDRGERRAEPERTGKTHDNEKE